MNWRERERERERLEHTSVELKRHFFDAVTVAKNEWIRNENYTEFANWLKENESETWKSSYGVTLHWGTRFIMKLAATSALGRPMSLCLQSERYVTIENIGGCKAYTIGVYPYKGNIVSLIKKEYYKFKIRVQKVSTGKGTDGWGWRALWCPYRSQKGSDNP